MTIGLLGGSFDPAHQGHVNITRNALARFGLDRIWWLVSPGNPLKSHSPAPIATRIAEARRLIHDPRVIITDIEARLGTVRTIDTIRALQGIYPQARFVWLMGSDNLVQFDRWEDWQEIAHRVPIGVLARPGSRMRARKSKAATVLAHARLPQHRAGMLALKRPPAWVLVNLPMSDLSSSAIRRRARGTNT